MGSMGWWAGIDRGEGHILALPPGRGSKYRPNLYIVATARRCAGSLAVRELWPPAATPVGSDI